MKASKSIPPEERPSRKPPARAFTSSSMTMPPEGVFKITREQAVEKLKATAPEFTKDVETSLDIPDVLYSMEVEGAMFFSTDPKINLSNTLAAVRTGSRMTSPIPEFGIAIVGSTSGTSALIVDMRRDFMVYERIGSNFGDASWDRVPRSIDFALSVNGSGPVLINDGIHKIKF